MTDLKNTPTKLKIFKVELKNLNIKVNRLQKIFR